MKVWDVFPYWRERWAVDARLRLWAPFTDVDYMPVALLGDRTHRGNPLPVGLPDPGVKRFTVKLDADSDWGRERQQRDAVTLLAANCTWALLMEPDDLILLCDADEFVDPYALPVILRSTESGPVKLRMANYMCGTRWRHRDWWRHPAACRARDLPEHPSEQLRMNFSLPKVHHAGWHLTYFDEDVDGKLSAFAHAEYDTEQTRREIADIRANGTGFIYDPLTGPLADILAGVAA
jgi:hypothetical protein